MKRLREFPRKHPTFCNVAKLMMSLTYIFGGALKNIDYLFAAGIVAFMIWFQVPQSEDALSEGECFDVLRRR